MTKAFLFGINGKMGRQIVQCAENRDDFQVVGGFDINPHPTIITFNKVDDINIDFDVIIDFSRASTLDYIIDVATKYNKPVVLASTGYSEAQIEQIEQLSTKVPVLRSGNMSIGVNTLLSLVEQTAKFLGDAYDVEIVEKHHNAKVDSPSGTALMLADKVKEVRTDSKYVCGRDGYSPRQKNEIGIHSIRGGTIVGEHDVIFAGEDEIITLSHVALSRKIFANGAIKAGIFLSTAKVGLYTMKNALM